MNLQLTISAEHLVNELSQINFINNSIIYIQAKSGILEIETNNEYFKLQGFYLITPLNTSPINQEGVNWQGIRNTLHKLADTTIILTISPNNTTININY